LDGRLHDGGVLLWLRRGRSSGVFARQFSDQTTDPGGMEHDGDAVGRDVDALNEQPEDPRLLGRVKLIPCADRLERAEGFDAGTEQMANSNRQQ
jgi:hypothetical protein